MLGKRFTLLLLLAFADTALAVVADSLTIGNAKALSLGNAVTADPPGIDAIHFNPAGLAQIKGRKYQLKVVAADFSVQMEIGDYILFLHEGAKVWEGNYQNIMHSDVKELNDFVFANKVMRKMYK